MAYTYSKLASYTVGSGGITEIVLSAIPQNYTDLKLEISAKCDRPNEYASLVIYPNGDATNSTTRTLQGNGSAANSQTTAAIAILNLQGNVATQANTFGSATVYIPNYTSSNYKSFSMDGTGENNATTAYATLNAGTWSSTAAITSLNVATGNTSYPIMQYSTVTLYGIKAEV
jgi:hypothetical protein